MGRVIRNVGEAKCPLRPTLSMACWHEVLQKGGPHLPLCPTGKASFTAWRAPTTGISHKIPGGSCQRHSPRPQYLSRPGVAARRAPGQQAAHVVPTPIWWNFGMRGDVRKEETAWDQSAPPAAPPFAVKAGQLMKPPALRVGMSRRLLHWLAPGAQGWKSARGGQPAEAPAGAARGEASASVPTLPATQRACTCWQKRQARPPSSSSETAACCRQILKRLRPVASGGSGRAGRPVYVEQIARPRSNKRRFERSQRWSLASLLSHTVGGAKVQPTWPYDGLR